MRKAVAEPAKQAGHPLDEATIDRLVSDTQGREGALPLLQFALTRIWEGLKEGKEPAITYREINGVGGALAGKAQEIYASLETRKQEIARRVFIGLVQLGEGTRDTRRRAGLDSLISMEDSLEDVEQVIHKFASPGARLISLSSLDGHEIAEVTHEALFDHWHLLNDWLDSDRDDIRFKRRLEEAAKLWDDNKRPEGRLWRPPDLDLLRDFQGRATKDMTVLETAFWKSSNLAEQHRKRNRRLLTAVLAFGLLGTSLSTGVALLYARAANRNRLTAENNSLQILVQTAATLTASGDPLEAGIVALRATKQFQLNQLSIPGIKAAIQAELLETQLLQNREITRFEDHSGSVSEVRFSSDGETLVTVSSDGTVKLWQLDGTLITTLEGQGDRISDVRFSPDGKTVATASRSGIVKLWQLDGTLITTLDRHSGSVYEVHFSPSGETVATLSSGWTVKLWQLNGTLITTLEGHSDWISDVRFSPDGKTVATATRNGTAKLWQLNGTLIMTLEGHSDWISDVRFSPDGKTVATASEDGTVELWQLGGSSIATLEGHSGLVSEMSFSSDGKTVATASEDGTVKLWHIDGTLLTTLEGQSNWISDRISDVRFSPDGKTLVTVRADGTAKLWPWDLQTLAAHTCQQIRGYLQSSPNVAEEDRALCD